MSISAIKCLPSALLIYSVCISQNIFAKDYYDPSLLRIGDDSHGVMSNEDLSIFESLDTPPGHYQIELYINKNKVEYRNVYLYSRVDQAQNKHLLPCLSLQDLKNYGIRLPKVQLIQLANSNQCVDLSEHDFIRSDLDMNSNTLSLKIPQSYIDTEKLLQFEQQYWDQGIPAVLVDYSFSQFNSRRNHQSYNSYFTNIRGGINYGAWRLNNYSNWIRNESGQSQWNNINTTLSRNIQSIKGELSLGNVYTASTLFDGIKINGVKLQSDRQMQPISSASYAPGINGIADAESIITIKQNDQVIYKKAVAAGPFYITDYYPMSSGGNLFVDIESMDGIKKQLIVPFSSMSILERKGNFNYHFASGQYQSNDQNDDEYIHQADLFYGATDYVTLSTGVQASIKYKAFSLGTGLNLGSMGATSLNVIHSESTTREQKFRGNAFKLNYNKVFTPTNTNVTLVGYKHFDDTYMSFTEAMAYDELNNKDRKLKNEFTAALTQTLPNQWGSLNLSSTIYQYSQNRNTRSFNLGYSLSRNQFNYGVYYRYFDGESVNDLRSSGKYDLSFNISFPLSFKSRPIYSSYNLSRSSEGGSYTPQWFSWRTFTSIMGYLSGL
ncbi:pili synthesis usher PapC-like protein [Acinetobacter calcoaceticus]|uniref:Pili synthesis usher PapC-like protein n=1 Tax=Acinetobacter calcoaceticus TaxID=471 RepID=A0A4R1XNF4_ACICA|nr:pili synthesis usher PapC-like protein [Acinetobacter calcoaceticus]